MAFTNLTQLTQAQYQALRLTAIGSVDKQPATSPDTRVNVQLGGWDGQDVLAFTVTNASSSASGLSINTRTTESIIINTNTGTNPQSVISYWTVNVGSDNGTTDWTVNFLLESAGSNPENWVFTKGKTDDDIYNK